MVELFANSGDPDQTPHSAVSDLGLHCLSDTCFGVSSLQGVNKEYLVITLEYFVILMISTSLRHF